MADDPKSTNLAKSNAASQAMATIVAQKIVPPRFASAIPQDDWDAMPVDERLAALVFFADREQETTDGMQVQFPVIKFPGSSSSMFELPTATGDPEGRTTLEGAVVFKTPARALWLPIDRDPVKGTAPTCKSSDGVAPDGGDEQQSKLCANCKWNEWETGKGGVGKGCRERVNVFLMLGDDEIPSLLSLPPTSIREFGRYTVQVRKAKYPGGLSGVRTAFGLQKAKSKVRTDKDGKSEGGIEYNVVTCRAAKEPLTYKEMLRMDAIRKAFESQMLQRGVTVEDAKEDEPGGEGTVIEGKSEPVPF